MIIQYPGKINDRIKILGTPFIPFYLIKGKNCALIEGGIKALYPLLKNQLEESRINLKKISHLILLHSHIDHRGIANPIKKDSPDLLLCASEQAAKAVSKEEISPAIKKMEESIERFLTIKEKGERLESIPNKINVDKILREGDKISLGDGITINIISTPGHSSCSLSAYIPEQKALFVSDSVGLPLSPKLVFPMVFGNFEEFISTCQKLSEIDADIICFGHFLVLTGKDVQGIFLKIRDEANRMKEIILEKFSELKDISAVIKVLEKRYNKGYIKNLPYVFYEGSARAIIKLLLPSLYL